MRQHLLERLLVSQSTNPSMTEIDIALAYPHIFSFRFCFNFPLQILFTRRTIWLSDIKCVKQKRCHSLMHFIHTNTNPPHCNCFFILFKLSHERTLFYIHTNQDFSAPEFFLSQPTFVFIASVVNYTHFFLCQRLAISAINLWNTQPSNYVAILSDREQH